MLISIKSFKNFCTVNTSLFLLGLTQFKFLSFNDKNNLFIILITFLLRNYLLINLIDYSTKNKEKLNNNELPIENYKYEFHINVLTSTFIESITHIFIKKYIINNVLSRSSYYELLYFIPISFLFEIIFDFFHYLTHRLLHHKYVYKFLHKKHHKFKHPISITTFYQDPIDLLITNSFPTILSLLLLPSISYLQFNFIIIYKNFIEISGHSGKKSYPSGSFVQFIWLPKILNIDLYTEDHDYHHSLNNCNYSKRFSLWDKIFNTYKS
jgi:sterol desaturase/sphingolipid hydroxylase (fatty acid hydroxylase superfamily)